MVFVAVLVVLGEDLEEAEREVRAGEDVASREAKRHGAYIAFEPERQWDPTFLVAISTRV